MEFAALLMLLIGRSFTRNEVNAPTSYHKLTQLTSVGDRDRDGRDRPFPIRIAQKIEIGVFLPILFKQSITIDSRDDIEHRHSPEVNSYHGIAWNK